MTRNILLLAYAVLGFATGAWIASVVTRDRTIQDLAGVVGLTLAVGFAGVCIAARPVAPLFIKGLFFRPKAGDLPRRIPRVGFRNTSWSAAALGASSGIAI